jgi:hypothetical protein
MIGCSISDFGLPEHFSNRKSKVGTVAGSSGANRKLND